MFKMPSAIDQSISLFCVGSLSGGRTLEKPRRGAPIRLFIFLFIVWIGFGIFVQAQAQPTSESTRPAGAELIKVDVMGVFAHPDDETGVAALLAHLALGEGRAIANVYCTRGEGGGNMVGTQSGDALGILREIELKQCLAELGVRHTFFLNREDFAYTESLVITLEKWGHEATLERLVRLIRVLRPEVLLTMNPAPTPGQHGNHQAAGWLAVEAFNAAADAERFPEQLSREGLQVWQARKLYHGGVGPFMTTIDVTQPLPDGRTAADVAGRALSHHQSQGFGRMAGAPWLRRPQQLQLVKSVVPFTPEETDLFRGLPLETGVIEPLVPPATDEADPPVMVRFLPRMSVERYQEFVRRQGIQHTAMRFEADIPVVMGEQTPVPLEILEHSGTPAGSGRIDGPSGWKVTPERVVFGRGQRGQLFRILQVTAPPGSGAGILRFVGDVDGKPVEASARLHPVPRLSVPKVEPGILPVRAGDHAGWKRLAATVIDPTQTWQGSVRDAADSSAVFRLAHDGSALLVEVDVQDDSVVSNIGADDIRGHWRSDSIELCIDPVVGAEHTLNAFKVGIFPFDMAGRVRAARDADALPGPIERTAPGMDLVSWKTQGGYVIRTRIPFSIIGIQPSETRRLGFNVLIYDGDKADAATGENINKSRIAWAPRSGVQGRPEDWGRIDLE